MAKVVLRSNAIKDLNSIWDYTARTWSEKQADQYYSEIKAACKEIGLFPSIGKEFDGIRPNLLGYKSGRHVVFYRIVSEAQIDIIRILHERMDIPNIMDE